MKGAVNPAGTYPVVRPAVSVRPEKEPSMSDTALIVIDVQESFRHLPFWTDADLPAFAERLQTLIDGARARGIPIVQIFHLRENSPFAMESGFVTTLAPVVVQPDAVFYKHKHSALVGTGMDVWLTQHGIRRLIVTGVRTEQCCETTARHASDRGWTVDYVTEATMTFPMTDLAGTVHTPRAIKAHTEMVLSGWFARIASVEQALAA
jgi:nicotinamidase-related amidase